MSSSPVQHGKTQAPITAMPGRSAGYQADQGDVPGHGGPGRPTGGHAAVPGQVWLDESLDAAPGLFSMTSVASRPV